MVPIGSMSMQVMIFVNSLAPLFFDHSSRDMTCAENSDMRGELKAVDDIRASSVLARGVRANRAASDPPLLHPLANTP